MNTRKTFCPGRERPRRRHSAREEAKSLQFGKIDWIQRDLKSATSNPAKVLLISSKHPHFVMNQITTPKKPPDQKQSSTSLTVWKTWNTHILQQKRYRILTSDLDPNSSRHGHLNEHQEDILPRKRPKACIVETKYWIQRDLKSATLNPAKVLRIMSQHHTCTNDPSLKFNKCKCWTQGQSQHQRSLQTRNNHPWASQSENHKIHTFCNKKWYSLLRSDLDSNSSRHVHLNEHQEDILPRKREAKKKTFCPGRPKAYNLEKLIESSETSNQQHRIQRKFCWSEVNHHFVMNQITTPKKPPDQKQSSTSLTIWITWNTHILQQKR